MSHQFRPDSCGRWPEGPLCSGAADDSWLVSFLMRSFMMCFMMLRCLMMRFMTCLHLGNLEVFVWLFWFGCQSLWKTLGPSPNPDQCGWRQTKTSYFDVRSFSIHQGFMNLWFIGWWRTHDHNSPLWFQQQALSRKKWAVDSKWNVTNKCIYI